MASVDTAVVAAARRCRYTTAETAENAITPPSRWDDVLYDIALTFGCVYDTLCVEYLTLSVDTSLFTGCEICALYLA